MSDIIRIVIGLVIGGLLWAQARKPQTQPYRRRAFAFAAGGVFLLTGYNIALTAGMQVSTFAWVLLAVTAALFFGALASLVLAWRSGEERQQHNKFRAAMRDKIAEREKEEGRKQKEESS